MKGSGNGALRPVAAPSPVTSPVTRPGSGCIRILLLADFEVIFDSSNVL